MVQAPHHDASSTYVCSLLRDFELLITCCQSEILAFYAVTLTSVIGLQMHLDHISERIQPHVNLSKHPRVESAVVEI